MRFLIVIAVLLPLSVLAADPKPSIAWRAFGLETLERLERESKKDENKPETPVERYQFLLDYAFALHGVRDTEAPLKKVEAYGTTFRISLKSVNGELFVLGYTYNNAGKIVSVSIDLLPKDWRVVFVAGYGDRIIGLSTGDGANILFDRYNPFAAVVGEGGFRETTSSPATTR